MRMQRCSISAVCGYSAWSMKLRWRFWAISSVDVRAHPGGDEGRQVRSRDRRPAAAPRSISSFASTGSIGPSGSLLSGAGSPMNLRPVEAAPPRIGISSPSPPRSATLLCGLVGSNDRFRIEPASGAASERLRRPARPGHRPGRRARGARRLAAALAESRGAWASTERLIAASIGRSTARPRRSATERLTRQPDDEARLGQGPGERGGPEARRAGGRRARGPGGDHQPGHRPARGPAARGARARRGGSTPQSRGSRGASCAGRQRERRPIYAGAFSRLLALAHRRRRRLRVAAPDLGGDRGR